MARKWVPEAAIYSALRRAYRSSPAVHEALNANKEVYFIVSKKGKQLRRVRFICVKCGEKNSRKGVAVDHIAPVVDPLDGNRVNGVVDWNKQIKRLFVDRLGLQILCQVCHAIKSKVENSIRRKIKKDKNT